MTPSDISKKALVAWVPAYIGLFVHGLFQNSIDSFVEVFIFYPMVCGLLLALWDRYSNDENISFFNKIGLPDTPNIKIAISLFILLPLAFAAYAMAYSQAYDGYDDVAWIVIVFGGLIIKELPQKLASS